MGMSRPLIKFIYITFIETKYPAANHASIALCPSFTVVVLKRKKLKLQPKAAMPKKGIFEK